MVSDACFPDDGERVMESVQCRAGGFTTDALMALRLDLPAAGAVR